MVRREPKWKGIDWWSLGIAGGVLLLTFVLRIGETTESSTILAAVLSFLGLLS
jgi:hypothetical protein